VGGVFHASKLPFARVSRGSVLALITPIPVAAVPAAVKDEYIEWAQEDTEALEAATAASAM